MENNLFTIYCSQHYTTPRLILLQSLQECKYSQLQNAFQPLSTAMCDQSLCRELSQPTSLTQWNIHEQGRQQGKLGTRVVAVDWFQIGSSGVMGVEGRWVMVGVQLAGLLTHLGPGLGVCVHVCVSGSWCVLAGRVLAGPVSDTTTVGPLWISFAPLLSCSTTCPPSCFSFPGWRPGCLLHTFHVLPSFLLLLHVSLRYSHIIFSIISKPYFCMSSVSQYWYFDYRCLFPMFLCDYGWHLNEKLTHNNYNWTVK